MGRRSPGEGTTRKLAEGRYECRVVVDGRRVSGYGKTAAEARAKAKRTAEVRSAGRAGTVASWLDEWLQGLRIVRKPQSWLRYESVCRLHIAPRLGHLRIRDVTERHVADLAADLSATGLAGTTVHGVHVVLGTALEAAKTRGLVDRNVCRNVRAPKADTRKRPIPTHAQVLDILAAARGTRFDALIVLAITTGAREGELLALQWADVGDGHIRIRSNMARRLEGGYAVGDPKTDAAYRTISLPGLAADALARQPRHLGSELVFPREDGGPLSGGGFLHVGWYPLLKRLGLPRFFFHDLRHAYGTYQIDDGVSALDVSAVMGHSSVAVTLLLYGHRTDKMREAGRAAVDARFALGAPREGLTNHEGVREGVWPADASDGA